MPELSAPQQKIIKNYFNALNKTPKESISQKQAPTFFSKLLRGLFNLPYEEAEAITTYFLLDQKSTVEAMTQHPKRVLLENGVLMACFFLTWLSTPTGNWQIIRLGATQGFLAPTSATDFTEQHSVIANHFATHLTNMTYRSKTDTRANQEAWAFIRKTLADTIKYTFCQGAYNNTLNAMMMLNIYRKPDKSEGIGKPTIALPDLSRSSTTPHNFIELNPAAGKLKKLIKNEALLSKQQFKLMIYERSNRYTEQHFPCFHIITLLYSLLFTTMCILTGYSMLSSEADLNPAHTFASSFGIWLIYTLAVTGFTQSFSNIFTDLPGQITKQLALTIDTEALKHEFRT